MLLVTGLRLPNAENLSAAENVYLEGIKMTGP